MIDPKSLRLGNWLRDYYGVYRQVAYVGETVGLHNDSGGTDKYQHNPVISYDIKDLHGIPLTGEVLEWAGFDLVEGSGPRSVWKVIGGNFSQQLSVYKKESGVLHAFFLGETQTIGPPVKFLHQIQNGFPILTGQELTFKP